MLKTSFTGFGLQKYVIPSAIYENKAVRDRSTVCPMDCNATEQHAWSLMKSLFGKNFQQTETQTYELWKGPHIKDLYKVCAVVKAVSIFLYSLVFIHVKSSMVSHLTKVYSLFVFFNTQTHIHNELYCSSIHVFPFSVFISTIILIHHHVCLNNYLFAL